MNINSPKELIKIFIFLFVITFIILNWSNVSWLFNYREISGLVYDFFNPYPESPLLLAANAITLPSSNGARVSLANAYNFPYSDKQNSLEIPSIGVVTSLVIGESTNIATLEKDLDRGVVYYPG